MWERITRGQNLRWILKHHGFGGTLRWLRRSLPYQIWLLLTPAGRRELNFDRIHGVDTDGMVPRWEMGNVGPNLRFAVQYLPSKPKKFHTLVRSLKIDFPDYTFIDIGSGKGRVLLLADEYKFRHIIGVEFSSALCEIARRNLQVTGCRAEVVCADATEYRFPDDPLVIYMCNPFQIEPMRAMVAKLEQSLANLPRAIYVIYWNSLHPEPFQESKYFRQLAFRKDQYAIFQSRSL